jgi:hypothetical protein
VALQPSVAKCYMKTYHITELEHREHETCRKQGIAQDISLTSLHPVAGPLYNMFVHTHAIRYKEAESKGL